MHPPQIGQLAVDRGLITPEQLDAALAELAARREAGSQLPVGEILVEKGFLTRVQLDVLLGAQGVTDRQRQPIEGFELIRRLGEGGMGATYLARQLSMHRLVAIKIMRKSLARNSDFVERFHREARLAGRLSHENIVGALDVGESGGFHYLAMEYVEGRSVAQLIPDGGIMDEAEALRIARQVARGLDCAGRLGIVHRDIKPDNIMVSSEGQAKLCDFGLAKQAEADLHLTQAGTMLGTPHYVSPEQARGDPDIDVRSDLYSLGATLFRMVTGQAPFSGATAAVVMMKHISDPAPWARDVNPIVSENCSRLIARMMAKKPADRYPDAAALIADIELVATGRPPRLAPARSPTGGDITVQPRAAGAARPRGTGAFKPVPGRRPSTRLESAITDSTRTIAPGHPRNVFRAALAVGVLLVLAALVLGGWLIGRSVKAPEDTEPPVAGPLPEPAPPGTPVQPPARAKPSVEEQFQLAEQWWRDHPNAHDEAIAKFRGICAQPGAGIWGLKAEDAGATIERARNAAAAAELAGIRERAGKLAEGGDYDAALAELGKHPDRFAELLAPKLRAEGDALRRQFEDRMGAAVAEAEKLSRDGEPARALVGLDKLAGTRYAAWAGRLAALRDRLAAEQKNIAELDRKRKLAEAGRRRDALLEAFDGQALAGRFQQAGALVAAERARIPADLQALVATELDAAGRVAAELSGREAARIAVRKALIGKEQALRTKGNVVHNAIITAVAADAFEVERWYSVGGERKKTEYRITFAELAPGELERLLPEPAPGTPDGFVAQAIAALARTDGAAAGRALDQAGAHPLAGRYVAKVDLLRMGAVEGAAKQAWDQTVAPLARAARLSPAEGKALLAALEGFAKAHGATRFAAGQKSELDRLQALAIAALDGGPESMQARVQALFRGRVVRFNPQTLAVELAYDFQDARQIEDWSVIGGAQAQVDKGQLRISLDQAWRTERVEHRASWESRSLEVRFNMTCERLPGKAVVNFYFATQGYDNSIFAMLGTDGAAAWSTGAARAQIAGSGSRVAEGTVAAMVYAIADGKLSVTLNDQPVLAGQIPASYPYPTVRPALAGAGTTRRIDDVRIAGVLDRAWLDGELRRGIAPPLAPGQNPWQGAWRKMNARCQLPGECSTAFDTKRGWYLAASRDFSVSAYSVTADRWEQLSKPVRGDGQTFPTDNGNCPNAMTYLPEKDALLFIGGRNTAETNRAATVLFAMETRAWSQHSPFTEIGVSLVAAGGAVYKYNGAAMDSLDFDRKAWTRFPGKAPPARTFPGQVAAYAPSLKAILLFGGGPYNQRPFDDTWAFDLARGAWSELSPLAKPPVNNGHSVCFDAGNELLVAHGGPRRSDTWVCDVRRNSWFEVQVAARPPEGLGYIQYDPINKLCLAWSNATGEIWALRIAQK
jgi:serine/threonine protein kinase